MSARRGTRQAELPGVDGDREETEQPHSELHGVAWCLAEIESDTLPEEDPWPEVRRRLSAYRDDRPGWRTGEIETTLETFEPGGQA